MVALVLACCASAVSVLSCCAWAFGRIRLYQWQGWLTLTSGVGVVGSVLDHSAVTAGINTACFVLNFWGWWHGGGGDDTKRRLRKLRTKFVGVRRTAPQST